MNLALTDEQRALRAGVLEICKRYPGEYWRELDAKREYPEAFVNELTRAGYLGALIPPEYGGAGLAIADGSLILQTIHENGGNAAACHAQMYIMGTLLRHGSEAQKRVAAAMRTYHQQRPFDFAVTLGDNFYSIGMASPDDPRWKTWWSDLYDSLGIPFYATLGNHDWGQPNSPAAEILYSARSKSWRMPAAYYTFTAGAAQFFALDTDVISEAQLLWLIEAIDAAHTVSQEVVIPTGETRILPGDVLLLVGQRSRDPVARLTAWARGESADADDAGTPDSDPDGDGAGAPDSDPDGDGAGAPDAAPPSAEPSADG